LVRYHSHCAERLRRDRPPNAHCLVSRTMPFAEESTASPRCCAVTSSGLACAHGLHSHRRKLRVRHFGASVYGSSSISSWERRPRGSWRTRPSIRRVKRPKVPCKRYISIRDEDSRTPAFCLAAKPPTGPSVAMFPRASLLALAFAAVVSAQQVGTNTAETHPKITASTVRAVYADA
jgi:hypothetical protein